MLTEIPRSEIEREMDAAIREVLAAISDQHQATFRECYVRGPEAEADQGQWQTELYQSISRKEDV